MTTVDLTMGPQEAIDRIVDAQPVALITDFDGTLSEIVARPELAVIDPRCRDTLAKLSAMVPVVAVLSGRHVEEVRRLVGLPGVVYVGNHGLERWEAGRTHVESPAARYATVIRHILEEARKELKLPGLRFEDKGVTASIHYRALRNPAQAQKRLASVVNDLARGTGVEVVEGRRVIELRPPIEVNKGTALLDLLQKQTVGAAIYAGDDTTDVDAFRALRRWADGESKRGVAVAVVSPEMPSGLTDEAELAVEGVQGWADFLAALAEALATTC